MNSAHGLPEPQPTYTHRHPGTTTIQPTHTQLAYVYPDVFASHPGERTQSPDQSTFIRRFP